MSRYRFTVTVLTLATYGGVAKSEAPQPVRAVSVARHVPTEAPLPDPVGPVDSLGRGGLCPRRDDGELSQTTSASTRFVIPDGHTRIPKKLFNAQQFALYRNYIRAFTEMATREILLDEYARITREDAAQIAVVSLKTRIESLLAEMTDEHVSGLQANDPLIALRGRINDAPARVAFQRYPPKGSAAYDRLPPFFQKRSDEEYAALHAHQRDVYDRIAQGGPARAGGFPKHVHDWVRSLNLVDYWDCLVDPADKRVDELLRTDAKDAALEQVKGYSPDGDAAEREKSRRFRQSLIRDYAPVRQQADDIVRKWSRIVPGSAQFKSIAAHQAQYVQEQERIKHILALEEDSDEFKALPENVRQNVRDVRGVTTISDRRVVELFMRRRGSAFYTESPESYQPIIDFIQSPEMQAIRRTLLARPIGPSRPGLEARAAK